MWSECIVLQIKIHGHSIVFDKFSRFEHNFSQLTFKEVVTFITVKTSCVFGSVIFQECDFNYAYVLEFSFSVCT